MTTSHYTITKEQAGQRIDVILASLFPEVSLREIRRNWERWGVQINGSFTRKGTFTKEGDTVGLISPPNNSESMETAAAGKQEEILSPVSFPPLRNTPDKFFDLKSIKILKRESGLIAVYKPGCLHSAALPMKRGGLSLEDLLPQILQEQYPDSNPAAVELFNRLDYLTTGIVLLTENSEIRQKCLEAEQSSKMKKGYLALIRNKLPGQILIKNALDTDSRRKTRILKKENPDPLRHTSVKPLCVFDKISDFNPKLAALDHERDNNFSLVEIKIHCGARHQIRAHLSHAGYPILGDPLYDPLYSPKIRQMFLHHYALYLPDFYALVLPPWGQKSWQCIAKFHPGFKHNGAYRYTPPEADGNQPIDSNVLTHPAK